MTNFNLLLYLDTTKQTMKFSLDKRERFCILQLEEEKLLSNFSPNLKSEMLGLQRDGFKNVILDLAKVGFIDSSGLSALLVGVRLAKENKGTFVITNINPHIQKLIKISQLESILTIVPTLAESIDYVMMEELDRDLRG